MRKAIQITALVMQLQRYESYVSTRVETFVKPEEKVQDPSEAVSAGNGGNENNRFGSSYDVASAGTFQKIQTTHIMYILKK